MAHSFSTTGTSVLVTANPAKKSILGTHVLFQQYHNKRPISAAWVRVDIDKNGRVYNIQNDLVLGFFDRYVKGIDSDYPRRVLEKYPELMVRDRNDIRRQAKELGISKPDR